MTPEENLANAIILQAVEDYRWALKTLTLKRNLDLESISAKNTKDEVERFFRSQWFSALTDIEGEYLIRKLKQEAEDS